MKRLCAWCNKNLGTKETAKADTQYVSHGICDECLKDMFKQLTTPLRNFLDTLKEPVLLIAPDPKVLTANKTAQKLLNKELPQIEGYKGGEVIDCAYSFTKKGCGKDVHCESCTIRNTVIETFKTGKSCSEVLAYPDIQKMDEVKNYCIKISTEKAGEFVLLRIDSMQENTDN